MATLILTLELDPESQAFFEQMRQMYFPPERNLIPAHLSLFHQLPENDLVMETLRQMAGAQSPFPMRCSGVRTLGRGVAYEFASVTLASLHKKLAVSFDSYLIAQDKQRFMPHIVVQNKTTTERARSLLAQLQAGPAPTGVTACGLSLWRYLGGPWEPVESFSFSPAHTQCEA